MNDQETKEYIELSLKKELRIKFLKRATFKDQLEKMNEAALTGVEAGERLRKIGFILRETDRKGVYKIK